MSTQRVNPFSDLSDFEPRPSPKEVNPELITQIDQIAEEYGFPSRQPTKAVSVVPDQAKTVPRLRRRYTTGRNQQINIKATPETIARLYRLADHEHLPLGELLEQALEALEQTWRKAGRL